MGLREYICCEKFSAPTSPNLSPHSLAPRPLSCPSHNHKTTCCSLHGSFMVGVGTQSLCLSCSVASTSTSKFSSCTRDFSIVTGDSQCMTYCFFHFCLTFAPHPSSVYQSKSQTTSLVKSEPNCSSESHTLCPYGGGDCLGRGWSLGVSFAYKWLWSVQWKLLCKHSSKYVLHCIIPSNKDSGIRIWLSVLLMLHGVQ